MSRLTVPCDTIPTGDTILTGKDQHGNDIEIKVSDLSKQPEVDICRTIESCSKIRNLDSKDAQLQSQINDINNKLDKNNPLTNNPNDKGIKQRLDEAEACCEDLHEKFDDNKNILKEVNDNISLLKNWNNRQDQKIEGLSKKVIVDDEYLNFEEWLENVYLPNADAEVNKWSTGDTYINVSDGIASNNSFYINVRKPGDTSPPSANDWQLVPSNNRNDLISILGIDPIRVDRTGKHTRTVSMEPNKLADMLSELPRLDLTKVDVSLGPIHFDPVFKEDATIEENLNVGNTTTTKKLNVTSEAVIERACIKEMTCDTKFTGTPTFNDVTVKGTTNLKTIVQQGGNVNINGPHVRIEGSSVEIPNIQGDTHFSDFIFAPDITIDNRTTTEHLTVNHETILKGHTTIHAPLKMIDPNSPDKPICMDNAIKNLFRPSYGMFKITGEGYISDQNRKSAQANSATWGLGSGGVSAFNTSQGAAATQLYTPGEPGNQTVLIWENEDFATPGVYLDKNTGFIMIDGRGEDAGIYRIDYGATFRFMDIPGAQNYDNAQPSLTTDSSTGINNMESIRSGIVVYTAENISQGGYIIDDKYHRADTHFLWEHDHIYDDDGRKERTSKAKLRFPLFHNPQQDHTGYQYFHKQASGDHTFTRSMLIKIDSMAIVAPYIKTASSNVGVPLVGKWRITDGKRNTGSNSQISIQKIANLGTPHEYHC